MIEDWIDEIVKTAGLVVGPNNRRVLSYSLFGKTEYPESLTTFPAALTFVENVSLEYDISGAGRNYWQGMTEFHLTSDLSRKRMPEVLLYFGKIRDAFAGNMTLNGKVASFTLRGNGESSIVGPVELAWGGEKMHFGLIAYWKVKELESGVPAALVNEGGGI